MIIKFPQSLAEHKKTEHKISKVQEFLKQIVYGGNDGIVTTFAIVAGFAGARAEGAAQIGGIAVLLFGIANLLADATAMGLGEFLSARSATDVYNATREKEMSEIENSPELERAETLEILRSNGVSDQDSQAFADILLRNPEFMADFMMNYEICMTDHGAENPALNGLATFTSFVLFGATPLIPYFLLSPTNTTFYLSSFTTFSALITLGLLRWKVTNETVFRCVGETVLVGGICAIVAYAVGLTFA